MVVVRLRGADEKSEIEMVSVVERMAKSRSEVGGDARLTTDDERQTKKLSFEGCLCIINKLSVCVSVLRCAALCCACAIW